jgi:hypothetical protein
MRLSATLLVTGVAAIILQSVWAPADTIPLPWHFGPLIVGLACLGVGLASGLILGNGRSRIAVLLGLLSTFLCAVAILIPFGAGQGVFAAGVAIGLAAVVLGINAIANRARRADTNGPAGIPPTSQ